MKKILVTGGAGFIGSHLCERLLSQNYNVICLDNLFTGSKNNISTLLKNPNFKFIEHNIISPVQIKVDEIYNLACPASPIYYQNDPIKTMQTSVYGANNTLEIAKKNNAKIFLASTSEIYGDPALHPQTESYWGNVNPVGVRACYDEGKRCAETLFFDYFRTYNLKIKVARIFNTYGPRMQKHDGRVVSNFIVQALQNKKITIYGDGRQSRSFCFIDNLIDGIISLMNTNDAFTGPVNLGSMEEITIHELAKKIIKMTNSSSKIIYLKLPENDPVRRKPDITLAKKHLSWRPNIKLNHGLQKTIQYFSKIINN